MYPPVLSVNGFTDPAAEKEQFSPDTAITGLQYFPIGPVV
jgi:hypothetical protein